MRALFVAVTGISFGLAFVSLGTESFFLQGALVGLPILGAGAKELLDQVPAPQRVRAVARA